ncbi:MAG: GntR family transcriptional regulator [Gemmiger sp.]|nr:GntR family transcriptional regulator [Gemmiger sp.]
MDNSQYGRPKYELIMEDLLAQIRSNDFSYSQPICTERQISEKYGVSRITAKRAITDLESQGVLYRKRGVGSFVTRNAHSSMNAPTTPRETSKMVSLLLPFDITKGGMFDAIETINRNLNQSGYFISIHTTDTSLPKEKANLKLLLTQNISGLVYYPMRDKINLNLLNEFVMANVPVVVIDKATDCPYLSNIISDNFEGGRLATQHLLDLGHRNIAFLTTAPIEETSSVRNRFGGYLDALRAYGIPPNPQNVIYAPLNMVASQISQNPEHPAHAVIRQLYAAGITAIFAENDGVAAAIKVCCAHLGLQVPQDISICGFDNSAFAKNADITTVNQNFAKIGQCVSDALLDLMDAPATKPACRITVPVELVVRASTAAPRLL